MRALVLSFSFLVGLVGCDTLGLDPDLERMIDQARHEPYEETPYFADGRVMRVPPPGSVPRERIVGKPDLTHGVAPGGEWLTSLPIPVTRDLVVRGKGRFEIVCAACHGLLGNGTSKVSENMLLRPPRSLHDPAVRAYPPGRIYDVIARGYGLMPSFATHLSVEDRWAVVAYVQALQLSQAAPLEELPPDVRSAAEAKLP